MAHRRACALLLILGIRISVVSLPGFRHSHRSVISGDTDSQRSKVLLLIAGLAGVVVLLAAAGPVFLGDRVHALLGLACHQNPERCLVVAGHPMALCARCLGLFLGFGVGALTALSRPLSRRTALGILLAAAALTALDVAAEQIGFYSNLIPLRLATGTLLGVAVSLMIGHRSQTQSISIHPQPKPQKI